MLTPHSLTSDSISFFAWLPLAPPLPFPLKVDVICVSPLTIVAKVSKIFRASNNWFLIKKPRVYEWASEWNPFRYEKFIPVPRIRNAWKSLKTEAEIQHQKKNFSDVDSLEKLCTVRRVEITQTSFNRLYFVVLSDLGAFIFLKIYLKSSVLIWYTLCVKIGQFDHQNQNEDLTFFVFEPSATNYYWESSLVKTLNEQSYEIRINKKEHKKNSTKLFKSPKTSVYVKTTPNTKLFQSVLPRIRG